MHGSGDWNNVERGTSIVAGRCKHLRVPPPRTRTRSRFRVHKHQAGHEGRHVGIDRRKVDGLLSAVAGVGRLENADREIVIFGGNRSFVLQKESAGGDTCCASRTRSILDAYFKRVTRIPAASRNSPRGPRATRRRANVVKGLRAISPKDETDIPTADNGKVYG